MTTAERAAQRADALRVANECRLGRAELRRAIGAGETMLEDVLFPVHPLIEGVLLADLVRWQFRPGATRLIQGLGRRAVRAGVNLLLRADSASPETRAWVLLHAPRPWARPGNGRG